jgi:hypothetical protein
MSLWQIRRPWRPLKAAAGLWGLPGVEAVDWRLFHGS